MSAIRTFPLPDVGEGLTEAEIVRWRVAPGDTVEINQMVVEIETAKAVVELPCPFAGTIDGLLVREGQVVPVGTPILAVAVEGEVTAPAAGPKAGDAGNGHRANGDKAEAVLVGYGVAHDGERRRRIGRARGAQTSTAVPSTGPATPTRPLAKPPVRALARDRGVDLATVTPTGPHGDVTRADVLAAVMPTAAMPTAATRNSPMPTAPMPTTEGERIPVRSVQRQMAQAMMQSLAVPQVTEWVDVDVRRTVALVDALKAAGARVTPLAVVAAAMVHAIRRTPIVNSAWIDLPDGTAEIHVHAPVHLGVAVASPRGLVVPCVRDIDRLTVPQIAAALADLTVRARAGDLAPADSVGGTITVTNVGVFGVDGGTPILNPGQASILAVGRILERPWVVSGGLAVRPVMQLSFTFDHRIVDGAAGSTFLADVAAYLEDPPG